jgi:hypothetical protein
MKGGGPAHGFQGLLTLDTGLVAPWTGLRLPNKISFVAILDGGE